MIIIIIIIIIIMIIIINNNNIIIIIIIIIFQVCMFSYSHWQPAYEDIRRHWNEKIIFTENIPTEEELRDMMNSKKHGIFIADDKASEIGNNPFFMDLLVRMGHHYRLTNCLVVQDASLPGRMKSVMAKNFHVNVMMRSERDRGYLRSLGVLMNDYKCLMDSYNDACSSPWSYFIIDTHPAANPDLKYRTRVFPDDEACIVYKSNKK